MKKTLLTAVLIAASAGAFAQGKIGIVNDAAHPLILYATLLEDRAFEGQLLPTTPLPSGRALSVFFYAGTGTSVDNLTLQTTYPISMLTPGVMSTKALTMNGTPVPGYGTPTPVPGGTVATFQLIISETGDPTPLYPYDNVYWGSSLIFTATPGASITYPSILPGGPSASTWSAEYILVGYIPEPSTFALAGLGGLLFLLRRRGFQDRKI